MEPIRVSANGRGFVQAGSGRPFFWLGDTQWELVRGFTLGEAEEILRNRAEIGFTTIQVMLTGVGEGTSPNRAGHTPWQGDDPAVPNEAYFRNVDAVLDLAGRYGLVLVLGVYHQLQAQLFTLESARTYARWIARRYRDVPHLMWSMYPRAEAAYVPVCRALAEGLQEGDGGAHLITVHPDPSPASSRFLHGEPWLAFHSIQTFKDVGLIVPMVRADRALEPVRPVVMAEGAYEAGSEYGFDVTPLWVRRQAYCSYLAGGHHAYGHNDSWRLLPTWRAALDAPGAAQMGVLRRVLEGRPEWWDAVPDQTIFAHEPEQVPLRDVALRSAREDWALRSGREDWALRSGREDWALRSGREDWALRSGREDWALAYLSRSTTVTIRMDCVAAGATQVDARAVDATWIDPITGQRTPIGRRAASGTCSFATPAGWEDALLLLEAQI